MKRFSRKIVIGLGILGGCIIDLSILVGCVILACLSGQAIINQSLSSEPMPPWPTVDYKWPPMAEVLEEQETQYDFFGDFSYCALFRLPDSEVDELLDQGLDWFSLMETGYSGETGWKEGILPKEVLELMEAHTCEMNGPKRAVKYTYLFERKYDKWWLVVIDEDRWVIYFYRSSW